MIPTIPAGTLNRRIVIQEPVESQDGFGQLANTWSDVVSTWASIRAATGKEVYAASSFISQLSHTITIRYRDETTFRSNMRVLYRGRVFRVLAISDPDESRRQLTLLCLELDEGRA